MSTNPPSGTRERLTRAAAESFSAKGFHATTTRDIAAAAGMSPAAVYVHHTSKESLLHELSLEGHEQVLDLTRAAATTGDSPTARLRALMETWVRLHAELHTMSRIVTYELDALSPEHRAEVLQVRRRITGVFREVVDAGLAAGEFATDHPGMTVTALISLGVDVARWWDEQGAWDADDLATHLTDLAVRMLTPHRP